MVFLTDILIPQFTTLQFNSNNTQSPSWATPASLFSFISYHFPYRLNPRSSTLLLFPQDTPCFLTNLHRIASLNLPKQQIPIHPSKPNLRVNSVKPLLAPIIDLSALSPMLPLHLLHSSIKPLLHCYESVVVVVAAAAISLFRIETQSRIFLCGPEHTA